MVHLCISVNMYSQVEIETNGGLIRTDVGAFHRQYEGGVSNSASYECYPKVRNHGEVPY